MLALSLSALAFGFIKKNRFDIFIIICIVVLLISWIYSLLLKRGVPKDKSQNIGFIHLITSVKKIYQECKNNKITFIFITLAYFFLNFGIYLYYLYSF